MDVEVRFNRTYKLFWTLSVGGAPPNGVSGRRDDRRLQLGGTVHW